MESKLAGGDSFLHRLDARAKVLVFLAFAWPIALAGSYLELAFFLTPLLVFALALKRQLREIIKPLLLANSFLLFLVLTMLLTYQHGRYVQLWLVKLSIDGLKYGLFLFFKSNEILLFMFFLLSTSPIFDVLYAVESLGTPKKLSQLLFFSFRYVHEVQEDYKRMMKAAKCRGFKPKTNLMTYKTYANIFANLLIKSYRKSERIYKAMLCRGFKGSFPRVSKSGLKLSDAVFVILNFSLVAVFIAWHFLRF